MVRAMGYGFASVFITREGLLLERQSLLPYTVTYVDHLRKGITLVLYT